MKKSSLQLEQLDQRQLTLDSYHMPSISIILISFNTKDLLIQCLQSIYRYESDLKKEIIVVDNASTDGSQEVIKSHFPEVAIIENTKNVGFSTANNQAVKVAKGKYVLLLNTDTYLKDNSLTQLLKAARKHDAPIASCRLINTDKSLQPQGGALPSLINLIAWMLFIDDLPGIKQLFPKYQQSQKKYFSHSHTVGWVGGTALLAIKDVYLQLGGLDEQIFMYGEDVDFCYRANLSGYKVWFFHKPHITHIGQSSRSPASAIIGEYIGIKYLFQKHKPIWQQILLKPTMVLGAFLRLIIFGIIARDETKKLAYQKAMALAR